MNQFLYALNVMKLLAEIARGVKWRQILIDFACIAERRRNAPIATPQGFVYIKTTGFVQFIFMSNLCFCFSPKAPEEMYCVDCKVSRSCCFVTLQGFPCQSPGKYLSANGTPKCFKHSHLDFFGINYLKYSNATVEEYLEYFDLDIKCITCNKKLLVLDLDNICMNCRETGGAPY